MNSTAPTKTASSKANSRRLKFAGLLTRWLMSSVQSEADRATTLEALQNLGEMAPHLPGLPRTSRELEAFSAPKDPDEIRELETLLWQAMYDSLGRTDKVHLDSLVPKQRSKEMAPQMFSNLVDWILR